MRKRLFLPYLANKFRFSFAVLALILLFASFSSCTSISEQGILVDILDIGKADCIVIQIFDKTVMIDTGEQEDLPKIHAFLKNRSITKIDALILSHFDKDHIGGASEILSSYQVQELYLSSFSNQGEDYDNLVSTIKTVNITPKVVSENISFSIASCNFSIFPPHESHYSRKEDNNASLIVEMENGSSRLLFCGDAMEERIEEFLSEKHGHYAFVKLPYHGRYLENFEAFIDSVSPDNVAMTCSDKNPPDQITLENLKKRNIPCFQSRHGSIRVSLNEGNIEVTQ